MLIISPISGINVGMDITMLLATVAGYQDKEVVLDLHSGNCITIQPKDSPPLLERLLEHPMDPDQAVESFRYVPTVSDAAPINKQFCIILA